MVGANQNVLFKQTMQSCKKHLYMHNMLNHEASELIKMKTTSNPNPARQEHVVHVCCSTHQKSLERNHFSVNFPLFSFGEPLPDVVLHVADRRKIL